MADVTVNLDELYGPAFDEDAIDAALDAVPPPRSPEILLAKLYALGVGPGHVVLDVGCGRGEYALQIAAETGCTVVALDQSADHAMTVRDAIRTSGPARVWFTRSVAEALPLRAASAHHIWCRDMLNHVDLPRTLAECARALRPGGHMVVYQTFATDLLEPKEAARIYRAFAIRPENMDPDRFERCATGAGLAIVERDVVGSEWREFWEAEGVERRTSGKLMKAARLFRAPEDLRRDLGDRLYEMAVADQLWGIYQVIGKLQPTIYVLRRE